MDVLARPWLAKRYGIRSHDAEAFLKLLLLRGKEVNPGRTIRACRDPKDDKFLEVAVAGRADVLVSGDADLQSLHPFENVPILSPASFLERLSRSSPASPADRSARRR